MLLASSNIMAMGAATRLDVSILLTCPLFPHYHCCRDAWDWFLLLWCFHFLLSSHSRRLSSGDCRRRGAEGRGGDGEPPLGPFRLYLWCEGARGAVRSRRAAVVPPRLPGRPHGVLLQVSRHTRVLPGVVWRLVLDVVVMITKCIWDERANKVLVSSTVRCPSFFSAPHPSRQWAK